MPVAASKTYSVCAATKERCKPMVKPQQGVDALRAHPLVAFSPFGMPKKQGSEADGRPYTKLALEELP